MSDRGIVYDTRRKIQYIAGILLPDTIVSKIYFRIVLKQKLDLKSPRSFNEKIQWYKLYYCPNTPLVIRCADKALLHTYLEEKDMSELAVPIIGVWKDVRDINFDLLPEQFVIKCNHGCGYNIIVQDKRKADVGKMQKQLDAWMKEDFAYFNAEPHYKRISKRIVCEKYLGDGKTQFMSDFKVHCFNGEPLFTLVCFDRVSEKANANYVYYDNDWNHLDYSNTPQKAFEKPLCFDEMLQASRIIAKDFPFVRVDFYEVGGKPYIGELTFDPDGGLDDTLYKKADYEIGDLLDLGVCQ